MNAHADRHLWLVRHGLPDYRGGKATDQVPGPVLTPTGYDQAAQAATYLRAHATPTMIYSSPLSRTTQTAATVAQAFDCPVRVDHLLREWHHTESLYGVNLRLATWLGRWLRHSEVSAIVVSHASPLLSIIRSALYLPHFSWWVGGNQAILRLGTSDRFEVSMGSVFALSFTETQVTARCCFHPRPRVVNVVRSGAHRRYFQRFPRPGGQGAHGEATLIARPRFGPLVG